MFHLFIKKDFESKGERKKRRKRKTKRESKKLWYMSNIFTKDGIYFNTFLNLIITLISILQRLGRIFIQAITNSSNDVTAMSPDHIRASGWNDHSYTTLINTTTRDSPPNVLSPNPKSVISGRYSTYSAVRGTWYWWIEES